MSQTLYEKFSTAIKTLPEDDMIGAIAFAESFVNGACHKWTMDTVIPLVEMGRPSDPLVQVFDGHTVREAAAVMTQLRGEFADEMARRGAPADEVREIREGGARVDGPDTAA